MRTVTRNFLLAVGVVLVLLLALGALPGYLRSGDPYYMTATPVADAGTATTGDTGVGPANGTAVSPANVTVIDATTLDDRRYPYTTEALADATADSSGQSAPYYRGPVGVKGAFTHSPFDESDALTQQYPRAVDGDGVRVRQDGTVYRLAVTQSA